MSARAFLAAAALAASVWAGGGTAQAAPGSAYGAQSTPSADTGAGNVTQLPGGADRPSSFAHLREQALAAMETLREDIATLTALRDAQAALLAWNGAGSDVGEAPETLDATLCNDPAIGAWCPLLPATFGASHTPSGGNTPSGGSTPSTGDTEDGHDRD